MKNIRNFSIAIIVVLFYGCQDYLDTQPFSFVTIDTFYQTPAEAELALTGVYNILTANQVEQGFGNNATYSRNLMVMLNGATDETFVRDNSINPDYVVWGNANFTAQANFVNEAWVFFYSGISRANYLIERIEPIEGFDGNRKQEIIAEARLLRGFYHMMLSMMHGGIPTYAATNEDPLKARNTIQEVYELILDDYEFAYNTLDNRPAKLGRADRWTAAGLLAKAHTYLASAKNSGLNGFIDINSFDWVDSNQHYLKALDYTQDVVHNSGYKLTNNYDYLFRETTKSHQYEEYLFGAEASSSPTVNVVNILSNAFTPQGNINLTGGGFGWFRPSGELYNLYTDADFRRDHNLTGNIPATADVEVIEGVRYYVPRPFPNINVNFYCIGKYRMMDPAEKTLPNWATSYTIPILRFADVMLLHAEALYFTGNEAEARSYLSQVRERSVVDGFSVQDLNDVYQRSNFLDELLDERSRELCFENWRRIDLARFNRFNEAIQNLSTEEGSYNRTMAPIIQNNWRPERVWFPLPTIQLDLNINLIQNQGY